jgi:hypothetical protein
MDNLTLAITLKAFDEMSRVVGAAVNNAARNYGELQEKVAKVSDKMQHIGTTTAAVGIAIGAAALKPINAFSNLEDAVTRAKVAFMTNQGVDKGFSEVQRVAEVLGAKLPGTTADFTVMASKLKELGLATKTIAQGGLEATADMRVLMGSRILCALAKLSPYAAFFSSSSLPSSVAACSYFPVIVLHLNILSVTHQATDLE